MTHNNNPTTQEIEMEPSQVLSQPQHHRETFILKNRKNTKEQEPQNRTSFWSHHVMPPNKMFIKILLKNIINFFY